QEWQERATQGRGRLDTLTVLYAANFDTTDLTHPDDHADLRAALAFDPGTATPLPPHHLANPPRTLILTRYALATPHLTGTGLRVPTDAEIINAANQTRHHDPDPAILVHHLLNPTPPQPHTHTQHDAWPTLAAMGTGTGEPGLSRARETGEEAADDGHGGTSLVGMSGENPSDLLEEQLLTHRVNVEFGIRLDSHAGALAVLEHNRNAPVNEASKVLAKPWDVPALRQVVAALEKFAPILGIQRAASSLGGIPQEISAVGLVTTGMMLKKAEPAMLGEYFSELGLFNLYSGASGIGAFGTNLQSWVAIHEVSHGMGRSGFDHFKALFWEDIEGPLLNNFVGADSPEVDLALSIKMFMTNRVFFSINYPRHAAAVRALYGLRSDMFALRENETPQEMSVRTAASFRYLLPWFGSAVGFWKANGEQNWLRNEIPPTDYAKTKSEEDYAEGWALHHLRKDIQRVLTPLRSAFYDYIERSWTHSVSLDELVSAVDGPITRLQGISDFAALVYVRTSEAAATINNGFVPDTLEFIDRLRNIWSQGDENEIVELLAGQDWSGHQVAGGLNRTVQTVKVRGYLKDRITRAVSDPEIHAAVDRRVQTGDFDPDPELVARDIERQHDLAAEIFGKVWRARLINHIPLPDSFMSLRIARDGFPDLTRADVYAQVHSKIYSALENSTVTLAPTPNTTDLPRHIIEIRQALSNRISASVTDLDITGVLARRSRPGGDINPLSVAKEIFQQRELLAGVFEQVSRERAAEGVRWLDSRAAVYASGLDSTDLTRLDDYDSVYQVLRLDPGIEMNLPVSILDNPARTVMLTRNALGTPDRLAVAGLRVPSDAEIVNAAAQVWHANPDPVGLAHRLLAPAQPESWADRGRQSDVTVAFALTQSRDTDELKQRFLRESRDRLPAGPARDRIIDVLDTYRPLKPASPHTRAPESDHSGSAAATNTPPTITVDRNEVVSPESHTPEAPDRWADVHHRSGDSRLTDNSGLDGFVTHLAEPRVVPTQHPASDTSSVSRPHTPATPDTTP
ncbi:hypothetical protein ABT215_41840, partial [Streptomyces sp900105755]|uniref:hypothetical protein n=1 Tax=Streptomyces sp. 900105755 TaxID=3154389 RepID=UPI00332B4E78